MRLAYRLVLVLLLLQLTATATLWTLSPTEPAGQAVFATLLGVDLLAFAMVSYLYRTEKAGRRFARGWVLAGCGMFTVLLLAALVLA